MQVLAFSLHTTKYSYSYFLIHPRWFFYGPSKVVSWNMSFDLDLDFAQMMYETQNPDPRKKALSMKKVRA